MYQVDHFYEPGEEDNPEYYANLLEYNYNENSQTDMLKFNVEMENEYTYNNRNWITAMASNKTAFDYTNSYFRNGNVKTTEYSGEYNNNFGNSSDLTFTYEYDRSNRLLEAVTHDNKFEISNSYDKDGNILTLDRKGSAGSSVDDFNYSYYSGTNNIRTVQGSKDQFIYDYNGNLITDSLNSNFSIHYDHRNLITDLIQRVILISGITPADTSFYKTYYYYDESGNRIRKKVYNDENDSLLKDIVYSRDVSGKEMAIYENESIKQWNIWGTDNAGFINANGDKRYYLKDHLGSVRAVLDEFETVISSQDYDAWGYQLQDRNYDNDVSIYKFTSKERDEENKYDYFGARYYDARIGRWGQVEPLLDKYPALTPYNYSVDNPLRVIDPNGADPFEIIVRTYIPFDVVFPGFKGDSRGTDPNASSFRTEQRVTIETDRSKSSTIIQGDDKAILSPSTSINPNGVPPFLHGVGEGTFSVVASYSSDVNEGNNASVELSGEANVGIIPSIFTPAIDYSFGITILPQKDGSVQVLLSGSHDKFPAYEIYIKDKSGKITTIYNQSPVDPIVGPFDLFPFPIGDVKTKVNSNQLIP